MDCCLQLCFTLLHARSQLTVRLLEFESKLGLLLNSELSSLNFLSQILICLEQLCICFASLFEFGSHIAGGTVH